jgi:hypothetical protein
MLFPRRRVAIQSRGLRRLWRGALRRILFLYTADIVGRRITEEPRTFHADDNLVLHRVTSLSDPILNAPGMYARRPRGMAGRFERGDVAYIATVQGEVAAWVWLSRVSYPTGVLRIRLAPGDCYMYDLWAFPEYRKLGAGGFVMSGLLRELYNESIELHGAFGEVDERWVYGYIDRPNLPSLLLHRIVLGCTLVQSVKHLQILNCFWWQIPFTDKPPSGPCSRKRYTQRTPSRRSTKSETIYARGADQL